MSAAVRRREPCAGPATVAVEIGAGAVEVHLDPSPGAPDEVRVVVDAVASPTRSAGRESLADAADAGEGLNRILGFLGRLTDDPQGDPERVDRALAAVDLDWADGVLTVRGPRDRDLATVPLAVTVHAPDSSALRVDAGSATVRVSGRSGAATIETSGSVALADAVGPTGIRSGAGRVDVTRASARLDVTGGSGRIEVGNLLAPAEISTGAGAVHLRQVAADATVHSGAGAVTVDDASSGRLDLSTQAGKVRVGVHGGVDAEVDLRTRAGRARSDLTVGDTAPAEGAPLHIRGRSGAGEVRVMAASR